MKKNLILRLGLLLISNFVFAQNGVQTINMPTGFTWPQIRAKNCMLATQDDFVYVGFRTIGLGIWNGTSWTMKDSTDWGVPSNEVKALEFKNDTLWIGTTAGLVYSVGNSYGVYRTSNSNIASDTINAIFSTNGRVWVATPRGLSRISGGAITTYNTGNGILANDVVNCVSGTSDGSYLWIGTASGMSEVHNNLWLHFDSGNSILPAGAVSKMEFDGDRLVLCSATNPYVFAYQPGQFQTLNNGPAIINQGPTALETYQGKSLLSAATGTSFKITGNSTEHLILPNAPATLLSVAPSGNYLWYTKIFTGPTSDSVGAKLRKVDLNVFENDPFSLSATQNNIDISNQTLDKNNLRSLVRSTGEFFWDRSGGNALCDFPKGSGKNISFANALWLSGIDGGGQLHLAAQTYRQTGNDWWPGPLNPANGSTDSATTIAFNKAWKIDRNQIEEFKFQFQLGNVTNGTYQPHPVILNWPVSNPFAPSHGLAEFIDVNGDGTYNPLADGDYPKIEGDQAIFWVMNDNFSAHTETGGAPLKAEVHAMAFSYNCNSLPDSLKVLNATNFFRYKIINRGTENFSSCVIGLWNDYDLGDYSDDYVGTDSVHNAIFAYNSDAFDGTGAGNSYGNIIPVSSLQILQGPAAAGNDQLDNNNNGTIDETNEECLLSGSMFYSNVNGATTGNPSTSADFYNYLNQRWKDSTSLALGGNGYQTGNGPVRFGYSGSPWNPAQWNATGVSDLRMLANVGKFSLAAGDTAEIVWALSASLDSSLTWGTQAYYEHAENDRAELFSWFRNNGNTPCTPPQVQLGLSNLPTHLCEGTSLNLQINSSLPLPTNTQVIIQKEGNNFSFFQPVNIDTISMSGTQQNIVLPYNLLGNPDSELTIRVFLASDGISSPAYTITVVNLPAPSFTIANQQLNALPLTTQFTNTTQNSSGYDFTWYFGNGYSQQNNATQVSYSYFSNGIYNVSLTITDPVSGCQRSNFNPSEPSQQVTCNAANAQNCNLNLSTQPSGTFNTCVGGFVNIQALSPPSNAILQWFRNGIALGGEVNPSISATQAGWYTFSATLPDGCSALSSPVLLNFNQSAGAPPSISASGSAGFCGSINLTLTASPGFSQYIWSNGASGASINVTSAGVFTVTGQSPGCDQVSAPFVVSGTSLPTQSICVATLEPQNNSSLIIWEKPISLEIDSFRVLKENGIGSNNWQVIGSVDYNDLSEFQDASASFSAANRYSMVVRDTCGGLSQISAPTKTIFLSVSPGVGIRRVLSWSFYDAGTVNNGKYLIYSGVNAQNMNLIDTVPATIGFYEDVNPVNGINTLYRVEKLLNTACTSSRNNLNTSSSNVAGNTIVSPSYVDDFAKETAFSVVVLPNPNTGQFTIQTNMPEQEAFWWMSDIAGRNISPAKPFVGGKTMVQMNLPAGMYLVHIGIGQDRKVSRIIVH